MKIRTTMHPDKEYEVDAAEYTDLARQGLLARSANPKWAEAQQLPSDVLSTVGTDTEKGSVN